MKNRGMHNSFNTIELQRWFLDNYQCWVCGKNKQDAFHHIMGRGNGDSECESSLLNAAPLHNFQCHLRIHGELRKDENASKLLGKTMKWLLKQDYQFNQNDKDFIMKYKKLYETV